METTGNAGVTCCINAFFEISLFKLGMARKRYKPEEIVGLLRQAEVLHGQGMSMADAIRQLGISEVTFYRWRKEYGGMSGDELRRLKELEKENERLRRAVSDLTQLEQ